MLGAVLVVAAVLAGCWLAPLDRLADEQVDAGLKRALASFAAARALNAVLSVAQGTELSVQPAGVGLNFAPGQVLDPINDLVEQFSLLMLGASIAFGLQRGLIAIGASWVVSALLTVAALAWAWAYLREHRWRGTLGRLLVGLVVLRFAVPVVALGSEASYRLFLAEDYRVSQQRIEGAAERIASLQPPLVEGLPQETLAERVRRWWSQGADLGVRIDALKAAAGETVDHIVRLIVVFLIQTLVLPLLLCWGLLQLARWLARPPG